MWAHLKNVLLCVIILKHLNIRLFEEIIFLAKGRGLMPDNDIKADSPLSPSRNSAGKNV